MTDSYVPDKTKAIVTFPCPHCGTELQGNLNVQLLHDRVVHPHPGERNHAWLRRAGRK